MTRRCGSPTWKTTAASASCCASSRRPTRTSSWSARGDGRDIEHLITETRPDPVVIEARMPHVNGTEAAELIRPIDPEFAS
jgi:DNA-binding NarL/FixJ family response regulator